MQNFQESLKTYGIKKGDKRYFPSLSMTVICQCSWNQTNLRSPNLYPHLVICQTIVLVKSVLCLFSPSQHILKANYISLTFKWVGYACFNNREGVDEHRSFKLFEYIAFFQFCMLFCCLTLTVLTQNVKQLNLETSLWYLSSAKQLCKKAPRLPKSSCDFLQSCILKMFVICSKKHLRTV